MVRYFYLWTPYVVVGAIAVLALPWLGLIALMIVALVALPALAIAIFLVPYLLIQAINGRWQGRSAASPQTAAVMSPATHQATFPIRQVGLSFTRPEGS